MLGRRISVLAIVAGLMLPAVVGCLIPDAAHAETMQCCAQLTCPRGHQGETCFSTTAPTGSSQSAPQLRTSLTEPALATDVCPPSEAETAAAFDAAAVAGVPQHSPPELFTLYLSLLI